jgi:integrase
VSSISVPSQDILDNFLCYCASHLKLGYSTIKLYLAAVKHHYVLMGYQDITASMPRLRVTLRGIQRSQPHSTRRRIPLSAAHMHRLAATLAASRARDDRLLWAAVCLGYFGGLRAGEFCSNTANSFHTDTGLCFGDVLLGIDNNIGKRFVKVHLKSSKCDYLMQGVDIVLFETKQPLCPYVAMSNYLSLFNPAAPTAPLFTLSGGAALSRYAFTSLLHSALTRSGLSNQHISGHSLRKGFATACAAAGVPDHLIAMLGRWSSQCYKLYISTPPAVIADAQAAIADPCLASIV